MSDGLILLMALIFIVIVIFIVYRFKKNGVKEVDGSNQIKDLRLELDKIKSKLSQITDPEKGDIYKYNYWFDIIETRVKDPIQDESNLSRLIKFEIEVS